MARIADGARPDATTPRATPSSSDARAAPPGRRSTSTPTAGSRPDTQANHVRALAFDLVPDELRPAVADRLVELIREAGTHLGTGFLATPYLLPVLADTGHLDVAYELLLQDTEPSWLAMVDRGATTMWEHWDGVAADGRARTSRSTTTPRARSSRSCTATPPASSCVEPALPPLPRPAPPRRRADLGRGRARVAVRADRVRLAARRRRRFDLRVVVPAGTAAEVVLPDGTTTTAGPGRAHLHRAPMHRGARRPST